MTQTDHSEQAPVGGTPALQVLGVSKTFLSVRALQDVSLNVVDGEIHALIGLNGSGKSTLVKILSGYYQADEGQVLVSGSELTAGRSRMAFVHQDLGVIPQLSVLENLALGRKHQTRRGRIDWGAESRRAKKSLRRFGLEDTAHVTLASLSKAERAIVAMARAMASFESGCDVLVLDEPTAALPHHECEILFRAMLEAANQGTGVLFITHRLREVRTVAQSVTVLRDGRVTFTGSVSPLSEAELAKLMAGKSADADSALRVVAGGGQQGGREVTDGRKEDVRAQTLSSQCADAAIALRGVSGDVLRDITLEVRTGEVVGVIGLLGSGLEELALLASGRGRATSGTILVNGQVVGSHKGEVPGSVGFIPADRLRQGIFPALTARENVSIAAVPKYVRGGVIRRSAETLACERWMTTLGVKPQAPDAVASTLSGGNQQKLVLARWFNAGPTVLVAEEPTQGIDVHSKVEILEQLRAAAREGMAVVILSSEFQEILDACDRVLILKGGRAAGELVGPSLAAVLEAVS